MHMHSESFLLNPVIFLAAAVVAVPLFKRFGLGSILGYLTAGALIGPWGLNLIHQESEQLMHVAELGVVMLLFMIGLELRPARLWVMRRSIFGLGAAQVLVSGIALTLLAVLANLTPVAALIAGFGLALSSTAFALQLLSERNEVSTHVGRSSFAVLLFQDLAVIPFLALIAVFAVDASGESSGWVWPLVQVVVAIAGVILVGRYLMRPIFRIIALSDSNEIFTAAGLLIVLGVALLMQYVGLSMALGAFLAGVLLADSEYRHQLEADIEPFRGILLGLFFLAVGMSIDFDLVLNQLGTILLAVVLLISVKIFTIWAVARFFGQSNHDALKLALTLSQGGEFAFVIFSAASVAGLLSPELASPLVAIATLSMVCTPILLAIFDRFPVKADLNQLAAFDSSALEHVEKAKVILIGFGRVGQVAGRILLKQQVPFVALDADPLQIELAKKYGYEVYYGDATRLDVLIAAGIADAEVVIISAGEPAISKKIVEMIQRNYPKVKILARARNRQHARTLIQDSGVHYALRETLECGISLGKETLVALGWEAETARTSVEEFRDEDNQRLLDPSLIEAPS